MPFRAKAKYTCGFGSSTNQSVGLVEGQCNSALVTSFVALCSYTCLSVDQGQVANQLRHCILHERE